MKKFYLFVFFNHVHVLYYALRMSSLNCLPGTNLTGTLKIPRIITDILPRCLKQIYFLTLRKLSGLKTYVLVRLLLKKRNMER